MPKLFIKLTQGTKGSQSAKRLAEALSTALSYKVWRSTKDNPKKEALVYSGGVDKLTQYKWFVENEVPALEYTTDQAVAQAWVDEGATVFGRSVLNGSCGKGIVVLEPESEVPDLPVYTKYKKKKREFRVHIFRDKVVTIVEKRKRTDWEGPSNPKIRNLENGYVFCQEVENIPEGINELALKAAKVVSSDFAGVDIGYNELNKQLFVIEVNSAPGIEGSNVDKYVQAIIGE